MNANSWVTKCCALGLVLGLSAFFVGCATQPSAQSPPSYQLADMVGTWSWTQGLWHGEFVLTRDGDSCVGTLDDVYERTYGDRITDVTISGDQIKFTRNGAYGVQHWEGTLREENGVLKIVDGRWTKEGGFSGLFSAERLAGSMPKKRREADTTGRGV
jgi:hypothetical protein